MNFRAILVAMLIACIMAGALLLLGLVFEVSAIGVPQALIVLALWILPGYYAARRAADAGALHGLLTGLLGMLLIFSAMGLAVHLQILPLDPFERKSPVIFMLLAGFWGGVGGLVADNMRMIKAKRALHGEGKHS